jgi:hypothetical protein
MQEPSTHAIRASCSILLGEASVSGLSERSLLSSQ